MHMDQIDVPFEFEEDSRQAEGKQQKPRRPEPDPLHTVQPDAVDHFELVLSRVETARHRMNRMPALDQCLGQLVRLPFQPADDRKRVFRDGHQDAHGSSISERSAW